MSTGFDTCEVVIIRGALKIVALLLGVLEAVFLIGLGASIPADDWFWGDLGQWLLLAGIVLGALLFGAEWLVRSWRFHHRTAAWADPLLRRFFPEGPSA